MGIRPRLTLVMGIDDLVAKDYEITDPRMTIPDYAPADLIDAHGVRWWIEGGYIAPPVLPDDAHEWKGRKSLYACQLAYLRHCVNLKTYSDAVFWQPEFGPANVIGVEIGENDTYNQTWLWALCVAMGDTWMQSGYLTVPSLRLEDDQSFDALALRIQRGLAPGQTRIPPKALRNKMQTRSCAMRKARLVKNGWNVPSLTLEIEGWAEYAGYVLRAIGLQHRAADLKLMLVRTWS